MTNDHFKELTLEESFGIEEEQVCIVVMDKDGDDVVFAGYFEEPEPTAEQADSPFWVPTLDLQGCHKSEDGGKTWVRVAGNQGMSYCELDRENLVGHYIPKKDLDLDECMTLWSD